MEDDPFTEGGTAQGAYSPYNIITPPTLIVTSHNQHCAQHTSDGNDQHSSRDARGDCAVGQQAAADASTDVSAAAQSDPHAGRASSYVTCARSSDSLERPHDHAMHAGQGTHQEGVSVAAPSAAAPHPPGALLTLPSSRACEMRENQINSVRSTSVPNLSGDRADHDAPLIDFSDEAQLRVCATPQLHENADPHYLAPLQSRK